MFSLSGRSLHLPKAGPHSNVACCPATDCFNICSLVPNHFRFSTPILIFAPAKNSALFNSNMIHTVATQQLALKQHVPMFLFPAGVNFHGWSIVGGFSFFFLSFSNSVGGVLQNLMLEGGPEAPFTSPISNLRQSHSTEPNTEQWGQPVGGNQVLTTFARQATATFNLTCLESGRAKSSLAQLQRPRLPGTM